MVLFRRSLLKRQLSRQPPIMSQACRLLSQIRVEDKLRQESQRRHERRQREIAAANLGYHQQLPAVESSKSDFDKSSYA